MTGIDITSAANACRLIQFGGIGFRVKTDVEDARPAIAGMDDDQSLADAYALYCQAFNGYAAVRISV